MRFLQHRSLLESVRSTSASPALSATDVFTLTLYAAQMLLAVINLGLAAVALRNDALSSLTPVLIAATVAAAVTICALSAFASLDLCCEEEGSGDRRPRVQMIRMWEEAAILVTEAVLSLFWLVSSVVLGSHAHMLRADYTIAAQNGGASESTNGVWSMSVAVAVFGGVEFALFFTTCMMTAWHFLPYCFGLPERDSHRPVTTSNGLEIGHPLNAMHTSAGTPRQSMLYVAGFGVGERAAGARPPPVPSVAKSHAEA